MFLWKGLSFITSVVGEPVRLHLDTAQCKDFKVVKVFVKADLSKYMPKSVTFTSPQGKDTKVDFSYPWLPPRCISCDKWGHFYTVCLKHQRIQEGTKTTAKSPV